MSYYPAQPSYAQPQPAYSPGSGYNGHGYHPSSPGYHPNSPGYFDQPAPYGAQSVVYVPGHSSSHRSRHHSPRQPIVLTGTVVTTTSGSSRHHRRGRHRSRHRSSHENLSLAKVHGAFWVAPLGASILTHAPVQRLIGTAVGFIAFKRRILNARLVGWTIFLTGVGLYIPDGFGR